MGRLVRGVVGIVLLAVVVVAIGLAWTHVQVQRERGPLPLVSDVLYLEQAGDLPTKLWVIETARQPMARSLVLDPGRDPAPETPYVMTYPAFVVEWSDGRLLLVDAGMSAAKAVEFGGLIAQYFEASPIQPLTTVAQALRGAASRVGGVVFTHLHIDHVDGLRELCPRVGHPLKVFMTEAQQKVWTYTTAEGRTALDEAGCGERVRIGGESLMALDGFPGVGVIAVGGHTPGSEAVVVALRDAAGTVRRYILAGDIANAIDGVYRDVPKPLFYRLAIVPEDDDRLGELRRYLRGLEQEYGFGVVLSHDGAHLKALGLPAWGS